MVRGLMSDREWAFFELFVFEMGLKRGPSGDHRLALDDVFWIAKTGARRQVLHGGIYPMRSASGVPRPSVPPLVDRRSLRCDAGDIERYRHGAKQRTDDRLRPGPRSPACIGRKRGPSAEYSAFSRRPDDQDP